MAGRSGETYLIGSTHSQRYSIEFWREWTRHENPFGDSGTTWYQIGFGLPCLYVGCK